MFCNNVCSIMEVLGHEYNPDQGRLFIDSLKGSLKVVLLHNGNRFPSVSFFYIFYAHSIVIVYCSSISLHV